VSEQALLKGQAADAETAAPERFLRAYGADGRFLGLVQGQPDGRVRPVRLFVDVGTD
jgi:tRNA pseudouridine55 synthase